MKKFILTVIIAITLIAFPKIAFAQENCVTQYGGGVVCGVSTPTEEVFHPAPTAIGDFNLPMIGAGFIFGSIALFYLSHKFNKVH